MFDKNNKLRHSISLAAVLALSGLSAAAWADAYEDAAKKWIGSEFKPSTLTEAQQLEELKWFIKAAEPFRGMKINVVSETLTTHAARLHSGRSIRLRSIPKPAVCSEEGIESAIGWLADAMNPLAKYPNGLD